VLLTFAVPFDSRLALAGMVPVITLGMFSRVAFIVSEAFDGAQLVGAGGGKRHSSARGGCKAPRHQGSKRCLETPDAFEEYHAVQFKVMQVCKCCPSLAGVCICTDVAHTVNAAPDALRIFAVTATCTVPQTIHINVHSQVTRLQGPRAAPARGSKQ